MAKIKSQRSKLAAYKALIRSVLKLYCEIRNDEVNERDEFTDDRYEYQSSDAGQSSEVEESPSAVEKDEMLEGVISDIIEVEVKIAEMIVMGRVLDYYQTDTVQKWDQRLGRKFPFMEGLRTDVTRAKRTLLNNYEVGVHLLNYFKKLIEYLDTLEVKKFVNYVGWYFVREVADVMTTDIRDKLNKFLLTLPKPRIQVDLNAHHCIEKLIGYHGVMEDGVAHLYLARYFNQKAVEKVRRQIYKCFRDVKVYSHKKL
ncbi:uncharacterized protein LOC119378250 [Rhipicephalus sanguineus]|uniref:uncharacterized protein LOC119378250 n=1 Tax=Rhipicephalus sanguineus TaxID=34632 RepID=UPI0020C494EA|nr:uncharacterized protein LOC119378250 [Rhipicephalus sanguineus]